MKLEKYWDDILAEERYRLSKEQTIDGWKPSEDGGIELTGDEKKVWSLMADGNLEWAKKIAAHYGIQVT